MSATCNHGIPIPDLGCGECFPEDKVKERYILVEGYPWIRVLQETYMGQLWGLEFSKKKKERGIFAWHIELPDFLKKKRVGKYRLVLERL